MASRDEANSNDERSETNFLFLVRAFHSFLALDGTKFLAAVIDAGVYDDILVIFSGSMEGVAETPLLSRARK